MRRKRLCILLLSASLQFVLVVSSSARSMPSARAQEPAKDAAQHDEHKGEPADKDAPAHDAEGHGAQEAGHGGGHGGVDPKRRATSEKDEGHPPGHAGETTVEVEDAEEDGRGIPRPDRWRYGWPYDTRHEHG